MLEKGVFWRWVAPVTIDPSSVVAIETAVALDDSDAHGRGFVMGRLCIEQNTTLARLQWAESKLVKSDLDILQRLQHEPSTAIERDGWHDPHPSVS